MTVAPFFIANRPRELLSESIGSRPRESDFLSPPPNLTIDIVMAGDSETSRRLPRNSRRNVQDLNVIRVSLGFCGCRRKLTRVVDVWE